MSAKKENKTTTNSSVAKKTRREIIGKETGACSYCKPHSGENKNKHSRHDKKTWKDQK